MSIIARDKYIITRPNIINDTHVFTLTVKILEDRIEISGMPIAWRWNMPERYQREIEDILKQAGDLGSERSPKTSDRSFLKQMWAYATKSFRGNPSSISPGRVMLASVLLLLSALVFSFMMPMISGPLAWAGLVVFIVGYAMFFIRPSGTRTEKHWRGQPIDYNDPSWWDRIKNRNK